MATRPGRLGLLAVLLAAMGWFGPAGLRGEVATVGRISSLGRPVLGQLLMLLPAAAARLATPGRSEALDGFTAGVVSALGVTMAATLTELARLLRYGNLIQDSSMLANLTQAVIRGVSVPLVAAAATGYISAALWKGQGAGSAAGGRWLTHPALAVAVALAVETGLGYADDAGLPYVVLLTVNLVAAAAALLALRIGMHHVLLHEGQCAGQGAAGECPNCGRAGPNMPFCPDCGVTERASGHTAGGSAPAGAGRAGGRAGPGRPRRWSSSRWRSRRRRRSRARR